jgi:hypothetical protein
MRVDRYIGVFEKFGRHLLVDKIPLPSNSLEDLKLIFTLYENDPLMYCEYDIDGQRVAEIKNRFGIEIDLENFDYVVSAEASD